VRITEIEQSKKQLDEAVPIIGGGIGMAGFLAYLAGQGLTLADYYRLAKQQGTKDDPNYDFSTWDGSAQAEIGMVAGSGLIGGVAGRYIGKAIGGIMKAAAPMFSRASKETIDAVNKAAGKVSKAEKRRVEPTFDKPGKPKTQLEKDAEAFMAKQGKNPDGSPLTPKPTATPKPTTTPKPTKADIKAAKADKKLSKQGDTERIRKKIGKKPQVVGVGVGSVAGTASELGRRDVTIGDLVSGDDSNQGSSSSSTERPPKPKPNIPSKRPSTINALPGLNR
jgi:hypothetical protein